MNLEILALLAIAVLVLLVYLIASHKIHGAKVDAIAQRLDAIHIAALNAGQAIRAGAAQVEGDFKAPGGIDARKVISDALAAAHATAQAVAASAQGATAPVPAVAPAVAAPAAPVPPSDAGTTAP